jgi:hypothetical protein
MFLPPAVTMMSFLRSVMRRNPSSMHPNVACLEPALGVDGISRGVGLVVIAPHDVRSARQYLPVFRDLDLDAVNGLADRSDAEVLLVC